MDLIQMPIGQIKPYENNPRNNDSAVDAVAESIRQCGYVAPIIIDEENVVLAGHTRLLALQRLGYETVNVLRAEGLSAEQKRKYRLLDNKTGELAEWDFDKLQIELEDLDFGDFDFGFSGFDFEDDEPEQEGNQDEPPEEFKEYDDEIKTSHKCPKCGYEW